MQTSALTVRDHLRCFWIVVFLVLGWLMLGACLASPLTQICHVLWTCQGTIHLTSWCRGWISAWAGTSLLTHLVWMWNWGHDYHRLAINCPYLEAQTNDDGLDGLLINVGSLPGFLLGIFLT